MTGSHRALTRFPHRSTLTGDPRCEFCGATWRQVLHEMRGRRIHDCPARLTTAVTVCAHCLRASCHQGIARCAPAATLDAHRGVDAADEQQFKLHAEAAATTEREIQELRTLHLEAPEYWER